MSAVAEASALLTAPILRRYTAAELGDDGYPLAWHRCPLCLGACANEEGEGCSRCGGAGSAKELVRLAQGHRCERCRHPYEPGCGEWEQRGGLAPGDVEPAGLWDDLDGEVRQLARQAVLWSPCDPECRHTGPVRVLVPVEGEDEAHWWRTTALKPVGDLARESGQRHEAPWRILTVHHLTGEKADLRWWNLAALCQRCHLLIQRKVQMQQVWAMEHSDWFKPHAAGWYAWSYRQEDVTYPEALARMDELLALERAL